MAKAKNEHGFGGEGEVYRKKVATHGSNEKNKNGCLEQGREKHETQVQRQQLPLPNHHTLFSEVGSTFSGTTKTHTYIDRNCECVH